MMIFVCSGDALLVNLFADLYGGKHNAKQLHDRHQLKRRVTTTEDLLIIDLEWFGESDFLELASPAMVLVAIPTYDQAMRLLQRGVRGYGNRYMHRENLMQAVSAVRAGQVWMPPAIISRMIATFPSAGIDREDPPEMDQLSKREEEVARWVARGLSNKELADKLHISVRTVKAHLTSIFSKTGFRDRLELAIKMKRSRSEYL